MLKIVEAGATFKSIVPIQNVHKMKLYLKGILCEAFSYN